MMLMEAEQLLRTSCTWLSAQQMLILHKMLPEIELMDFKKGLVLPWQQSNCGPLSSDKVCVPHPTTTQQEEHFNFPEWLTHKRSKLGKRSEGADLCQGHHRGGSNTS